MYQDLFALTAAAFCLAALLGWLSLPLGLAAAFALAWALGRRMDRFLNGLRDYAERISQRDFGAAFKDEERGYFAGVQLALESMAFDLRRAFDAESHAKQQLETALKGIQDGVLVADRDGRLVFANPSLEVFFQAGLPEKRGVYFWEAFREAEVTEVLKKVMEEGQPLTRELSVLRTSWRHLFLVASPLTGADEQLSCVLALFYDRTEQKRLEKMRSEFAANVSHELRTPLTAIQAALETLRDGALEDATVNRNFLEKAIHHSGRLHELVTDILSLAAIEEDRKLGRVDLAQASDLREAFKDAQGVLENAIERRHGRVDSALPASLGLLRCDRMALRQILVNLIENAMKYSGPEPSVLVTAAESGISIEVAVEDQGPGIPPEDLQRIFERFYRVDKARVRGQGSGGSGLGLAIVKHLVENYGGQVGVENKPDQGARFWFRIPKA